MNETLSTNGEKCKVFAQLNWKCNCKWATYVCSAINYVYDNVGSR